MEDPILEFLRSQARNYRCRVCGSNHKGSQLRKIGNHNNKLIVQVTCGRCRDSFFLHVEFAGSIVNAVEEVTRVAAPSPRDADEVDGEPLTSERIRIAISQAFAQHNAICEDFIVSHGAQSIILCARHRHEQVAGLDGAAVGADAGELERSKARVADGVRGEEIGKFHGARFIASMPPTFVPVPSSRPMNYTHAVDSTSKNQHASVGESPDD